MYGNTQTVHSNQAGIHEELASVVLKNKDSEYRKPVAEFNRLAFDFIMKEIKGTSFNSCILDSGCGTAYSTQRLAGQFPHHLIIGIEKSAHRLRKGKSTLPNVVLVRADQFDIWRLLVVAGIKVEKHYILYPNPWPKKKHLKRRIHGHPTFSLLPQLSSALELRSNWRIYIDEFACAWKLVTGIEPEVIQYVVEEPTSPFERKYVSSQHTLFSLTIN